MGDSGSVLEQAVAASPAAQQILVRSIANPLLALGVAVHFVARRAPFAGFAASDLLTTLDGQIRRNHCLFAFDGQKVVGYFGWARFDRATAEAIAAGRLSPTNELADRFAADGDAIWLLTVAAADKAALLRLTEVMTERYPGMPLFGVRRAEDGRHIIRRIRIRSGNLPNQLQAPSDGATQRRR